MEENKSARKTKKRSVRDWESEEVDGTINVETRRLSQDVKISTKEVHTDELRAILAHQIEFEIALRKRVAKVVQARIRWAEGLKSVLSQRAGAAKKLNSTEFKERAFQEFRAAHAPLNLSSHLVHPRGSFIPEPIADFSPHIPTPVRASPSSSKQLYLIPPTSEHTPFPPLLLLNCPHPSCPTPHPSTTLQGLLNHARIVHGSGYTFASHDEFIAWPGATVLLDATLEPERYARVSTEGVRVSAGGVRGLKALFEGALGGGERLEGPGLGLGLHVETPALANLLGRATKKGEIRAFGQNEEVDIEEIGDNVNLGNGEWKKYGVWASKRRKRPEGVDVPMEDLGSAETSPRHESYLPPSHITAPATILHSEQSNSSRFHVKKRVIVSDWSQSLRRALVQPQGPTHRWMIRLAAPSYSDHITTFLSAMHVQCASVPPLFEGTIVCSSSPFVVSQLAKTPFLARVTLVFSDERTKNVVITQWVDLDPMRLGRPVLGAEQIFDVELDRNAQPLPANTVFDNIPNSVLWSEDRGLLDGVVEDGDKIVVVPLVEPTIKSEIQAFSNIPEEMITEGPLPDEDKIKPLHERLIPILSKLRSRLPLIAKDCKAGSMPRTSYMVFETRSALLEAPYGRRKAVEWQYTRNMLRMLVADYSVYDADLDSTIVKDVNTAQLYAYLVNEKVFPRPKPDVTMVKIEENAVTRTPAPRVAVPSKPSRYCGTCGLDVSSHPRTRYPLETSGFVCSFLNPARRPLCDISLWTTLRPIRDAIQHTTPIRGLITTQGTRASLRSASQLVECASPRMTMALHSLTTSWGLKTFDYSARRRNPAVTSDNLRAAETRFPLEFLGVDASHVDRTLAPHALLAIITDIFVKRLLRETLRARAEMVGEPMGPTVLTTAHISRALMDGRGAESWLPLMAVAQIGIVHTGGMQG